MQARCQICGRRCNEEVLFLLQKAPLNFSSCLAALYNHIDCAYEANAVNSVQFCTCVYTVERVQDD
jgi:hypothetical protein